MKTPVLKTKPTGTPEYNPTPISELKEKQSKGKLGSGRAKYDLALLDNPSDDGEYDPACNFSTPATNTDNSESLPEYAQVLGSAGRKDSFENSDDGDSQLAQIPKFASVDYTPTVIDTCDQSDEDPVGPQGSWFSDENSDRNSEAGQDSPAKDDSWEKNNDKVTKTASSNANGALPIMFNADGSVNVGSSSNKHQVTKKNKSVSSKEKKTVKQKENTVDPKAAHSSKTEGGNIFNLFKDEFDSVLEKCSSEKSDTIKKNEEKVSKSENKSSSQSSQEKHKSPSRSAINSKCKDESSRHPKHSSDKHRHRKSSDSQQSSSDKSKSGTPSHSRHKSGEGTKVTSNHVSHSSGSHKSKTESSDQQKKHSVKESSHKTKDSSHKTKDGSNHSSVSSGSNHKHKSLKCESPGHTSSSKHKSSSSDSKRHKSSNSNSKLKSSHDRLVEHASSSKEKHSKSSDPKHSSSKGKSPSHSSTHNHHKSSSSSSSDKKKSSKSKPSSSKSPRTKSPHSAKKSILDLDVDIFGEANSNFDDLGNDNDNGFDSELEKFFSDEDPFDECLRIFNEESAKASSSTAADKKVLCYAE